MNRVLAAAAAGLLFGAGLSLSGMINPAKVIAFLDVAGRWDASLAFVMLGGLAVTAAGYRLVLRRPRPVFDGAFSLPTRRDIDVALLAGAALFGIGWGLAGYCPGPALAALGFGQVPTGIFVLAMAAGMIAARSLGPRLARRSGANR